MVSSKTQKLASSDCWMIPCHFWDSNLGQLEVQQVLLTTEISVHSQDMFYTKNTKHYLSSKYQPYLFLSNYLSVIYKINFYEIPDLILYNEVIM